MFCCYHAGYLSVTALRSRLYVCSVAFVTFVALFTFGFTITFVVCIPLSLLVLTFVRYGLPLLLLIYTLLLVGCRSVLPFFALLRLFVWLPSRSCSFVVVCTALFTLCRYGWFVRSPFSGCLPFVTFVLRVTLFTLRLYQFRLFVCRSRYHVVRYGCWFPTPVIRYAHFTVRFVLRSRFGCVTVRLVTLRFTVRFVRLVVPFLRYWLRCHLISPYSFPRWLRSFATLLGSIPAYPLFATLPAFIAFIYVAGSCTAFCLLFITRFVCCCTLPFYVYRAVYVCHLLVTAVRCGCLVPAVWVHRSIAFVRLLFCVLVGLLRFTAVLVRCSTFGFTTFRALHVGSPRLRFGLFYGSVLRLRFLWLLPLCLVLRLNGPAALPVHAVHGSLPAVALHGTCTAAPRTSTTRVAAAVRLGLVWFLPLRFVWFVTVVTRSVAFTAFSTLVCCRFVCHVLYVGLRLLAGSCHYRCVLRCLLLPALLLYTATAFITLVRSVVCRSYGWFAVLLGCLRRFCVLTF